MLLSGTARAAEVREFQIPAGPAEDAVLLFVRQAGLSVLYEPGSLDRFKTRAVHGKYEPVDALRIMLDDSGLDFVFTTARFIAVRPQRSSGPPTPHDQALQTVRIAGRASTNSMSLLPPGVLIRTINGEDLARQGFTTVPDWVRTLTQNQGIGANAGTTYLREATSNVAYGSGLNLYGIGQRATLILVDGQRLAPSGNLGSYVDVMNLPISAIDHIELISDGATTLYGADAVGGIVNFILRDNYSRPRTTVALSPPGALAENLLSHSFPTVHDRLRITWGFEIYSSNHLPAADRAQATSNLTPWHGSNFDTPYGNPGTLLDSLNRFWGIPAAQDGKSLSPGQLLPTPNLYDTYTDTWVLPQQRRVNGFVKGSYSVADNTAITFQGLINQRWTRINDAPLTTVLTVPSSNPFYVNPVADNTDPVLVLYGFGRDIGAITERGRVTSGESTLSLEHRLADWNLQATLGYTAENQHETQTNLVDFDQLASYLASSEPDIAFNPFGAGSNTPPSTLAAIRTQGVVDYQSAFEIASLKAVGSIPLLPAGAIGLTAGYDFRRQTFRSTVSQVFNSQTTVFDNDTSRNLHAVYLQSSVPLTGKLNLGAGVRYEHFSDVGSAFMPSVGFSFDMLPGATLFGTWAKMFRPPNLPDLNESINYSGVVLLPDFKSPTGYTNALVWAGNNSDLSPERSRSWMLGGKYSPPAIPRLTLDAQYYNIESFNQILPDQPLPIDLFNDSQYSYLYTRNVTAEALDRVCLHSAFMGAAGQCGSPGVGAIVDLRLRGAETVQTDGVDFKGLYLQETPIGNVSANLQATYILHFKETRAPGDDFLTFRNTPHNPMALRARAVLRWENQRFSVSPAINFQSKYTDNISEPSRPVSSWTTWDLVVGYRAAVLDETLGGSTTVTLRAFNVFNQQPPFLNNSQNFVGYDLENSDLLGRRLSLRIEHAW